MNIIVPSSTTPQDENTSPKREVVIENAGSAIEESLSEVPLTPDQKIEKLTAEVRNLTNGLNQLFDLSKMLMKIQIENSNEMGVFIQSMSKITQSIDTKLISTDTKLISIQEDLHTKITNTIQQIIDVQQEGNKKSLSNQKKLANGLIILAKEIIPDNVYDKARKKYKCIESFDSVQQ